MFLTPLPGLLAAEFPDDAAWAEFAIEAGVGAGAAGVQAFLAVGDLHFLADDAGVPVRVVAAFIHIFHNQIIANVWPLNQGEPERLRLVQNSNTNEIPHGHNER
jgi:hypothetical protein